MLRGVSALYRPVIPLVGVRQRARRRPALPRLIGQIRAGVSGVLLGGAVICPRVTHGLDLRYRPGQLCVLETAQVCVREGKRVPMDAMVPGPTRGGREALEGVVGVRGAGRPAAPAAVGHRVQGGVVWGQLLRGGGGGEGGGSRYISSRSR